MSFLLLSAGLRYYGIRKVGLWSIPTLLGSEAYTASYWVGTKYRDYIGIALADIDFMKGGAGMDHGSHKEVMEVTEFRMFTKEYPPFVLTKSWHAISSTKSNTCS